MPLDKSPVTLIPLRRSEVLIAVVLDGQKILRDIYVVIQVLSRFLISQKVGSRVTDDFDTWRDNPLHEKSSYFLAFVGGQFHPDSYLSGNDGFDVSGDNCYRPEPVTFFDKFYPP